MKIKQAFRRLSKWQKVLAVIACVVVVLLLAAVLRRAAYRIYWHFWWKNYNSEYVIDWYNTKLNRDISENVCTRSHWRDYGHNIYLFDIYTHRRIGDRPLRWVMSNDDSLAVAAAVGARAYINRFTGQTVLPFQYTRAWLFSEGLAAVTDSTERLFFIDHQGRQAIARSFAYNPAMRGEGYLFHGGRCIMTDSAGRYGMVDTHGDWSVSPRWEAIHWCDGYWELNRADSLMLLGVDGRVLVPKMKASASRKQEATGSRTGWGIFVEIPDKPSRLYASDGRLLSANVYNGVDCLCYGEHNAVAECFSYSNSMGQRGLLDRNGCPLTDAVFGNIEAIDRNLYKATLYGYPHEWILLDCRGKEVKTSR